MRSPRRSRPSTSAETPLRELNRRLHERPTPRRAGASRTRTARTRSRSGVDADVEVDVDGHVGYYCAGMNKRATVRVHGNAGVGLAENIMSGTVVVDGYAGQSCAATGRGGLVVVRGDASARCGISMKGVEIVVEGSVGHMSAFMAQKGALVVCGDAGDALGDSIYEARLYVRGRSRARRGLRREGAREEHAAELRELLERAGHRARPGRVPPLRLGPRGSKLRRRPRGEY